MTGRPSGHADAVTACAAAPDSRRVISASADFTRNAWDVDGGGAVATFEGHAKRVTACAVTPDGRCVTSASGDRTLKIWDPDGRLLTARLAR